MNEETASYHFQNSAKTTIGNFKKAALVTLATLKLGGTVSSYQSMNLDQLQEHIHSSVRPIFLPVTHSLTNFLISVYS